MSWAYGHGHHFQNDPQLVTILMHSSHAQALTLYIDLFLQARSQFLINRITSQKMSSLQHILSLPHLPFQQLIMCLRDQLPQGYKPRYHLHHILQNKGIPNFLRHLQNHLDESNIICFKKYEYLSDGVYILLSGDAAYDATDENEVIGVPSKKKVLFSDNDLMSSLTRSTIHGGNICHNRDKLKKNLLSSFSVIESVKKNWILTEDSTLVEIPEEVLTQTCFNELKIFRADLCANHFLAADHQKLFPIGQYFDVIEIDASLHCQFKFKMYPFRTKLQLSTLAIIVEGKAALSKAYPIQCPTTFGKYGLLLPTVQYEVESADLQVMLIQNNELVIFSPQSLITHAKLMKVFKENFEKSYERTITTKTCHLFQQEILSKQDMDMRNRNALKSCKQNEPYSIISMHLCKKTLSYAKKENVTKKLRQQRLKDPLMLFDLKESKIKGRLSGVDIQPLKKHQPQFQLLGPSKQKLLKRLHIDQLFVEQFSRYSQDSSFQYMTSCEKGPSIKSRKYKLPSLSTKGVTSSPRGSVHSKWS